MEIGGDGLIISVKNALVAQWWKDTRDTEMVKGDQQYAFVSVWSDKLIMFCLGLVV